MRGAAHPGRPRINVLTALPPDPAEAAAHAALWLPALAARADVAVWTPQAKWDLADAPGLAVRQFNPAALPARELNAADATFVALGADTPPGLIRAATQVPAITVLHDAPPLLPDPDAPCTVLAAADRAIALVAHCAAGAAALRGRTRLPVLHVPACVRCSDPAPSLAVGPAAPPYRLVAFGAGRVSGALLALAAMPQRGLFRLDAFGAVADQARAEAVIRQHGLHREATLHGDAPVGALSRALAGASLGIALGGAPAGASGKAAGLLRAWAQGVPVITDRDANQDADWTADWNADWNADWADGGAVLAVAGADDAPGIARHFLAFHANQDDARAVGRRGWEIARVRHAPERTADALLAIAADAPRLHAGRAALDLARVAAAALLEMVDAPTLRPTAPAVARAVADLCGLKE